MSYAPLTPESLPDRLRGLAPLQEAVGPDPAAWTVSEVGDGNLNLVFIVAGPNGDVVVKQALPYVRLVGDSWPLPLRRAFFEYHALTRQSDRDPGRVPKVLHFDEAQALIVMERLHPHVILRGQMMAGRRVADLGPALGRFCARTAFRGSDLSMRAAEKKADAALFAGNAELCDITERLVFTDPYYDAELNRHSEGLEPIIAELRADAALKVEVQHLKRAFTSRGETLCHGDLHAGSVMVTADEARVIDPEFAFYGPLGFDIGMMIGNYLMAFHAMPAHIADPDERQAYQDWILATCAETWAAFTTEFARLWRTERAGILYPAALYDDQGQPEAAETALRDLIEEIRADMIGFAGIEMHRRILGLAHIAEFDSIEDAAVRAPLEARSLRLGRDMVRDRRSLSVDDLLWMARRSEEQEVLP